VNFKCFFNWLVDESLIESSPTARLPKPKVPEERVEPFTMEQVKRFSKTAHSTKRKCEFWRSGGKNLHRAEIKV
jgi:site-specific recombinase XerD